MDNSNQQNLSEELLPQQAMVETSKYDLKEGELKIDFSGEITEVTLQIDPKIKILPHYDEQTLDLPVVETLRSPVMSYIIDRKDIRCPMKRKTFLNMTSEDISKKILTKEMFSFFFNDQSVVPTIISEFPLIFHFDFQTIEGRRELKIKNLSVENILKYVDDKTECDWVIKQNNVLSVYPPYERPLEVVSQKKLETYSILVTKESSL